MPKFPKTIHLTHDGEYLLAHRSLDEATDEDGRVRVATYALVEVGTATRGPSIYTADKRASKKRRKR
jgi:hypothetical protein